MYIFKQAKNAIFHFDKYPELLETKLSKVIFYALFFIIFFNAIYSSYPFISYYTKTKGFDNFVEKYIPDFKVIDEKLVIDEYYKTSTPLDMTIIFDPEENNYITEEDKKDVKGLILKVTPTHIISSELGLNIQISSLLNTFNIYDKSDLSNTKYLITISNIIAFILLFLIFILKDILLLLIFTILISLISSFYGLKLSYQTIFKLAIYVSTIPYIFKIVFYLFSIPIPYIIYIGIILSYLHFIFKTILIDNNKSKINAN